MKSKEIFKLAVRLLGLVFLYRGLSACPAAIAAIIPATHASSVWGFVLALIMVAWPLAVGCWLIRGAPLLLEIAYLDDRNDGEQQVCGASEKKADV